MPAEKSSDGQLFLFQICVQKQADLKAPTPFVSEARNSVSSLSESTEAMPVKRALFDVEVTP